MRLKEKEREKREKDRNIQRRVIDNLLIEKGIARYQHFEHRE